MARKSTKTVEEDEKPVKKKEYKFDIFHVLGKMDKAEFNFYSELPDEDKKGIQPLILMRWMSVISDSSPKQYKDYFIEYVNERVNIGFWELTKYPDLMWKKLCSVGPGNTVRHEWVPTKYKQKKTGIDALLLSINPNISDFEIKILRKKLTRDKLYQMMRDRAWEDKEMKPLLDEFDNGKNRK